jgi:ABC-type uncharacterized transport system permease subunit
MHLVAAALYLALSARLWQTRWRRQNTMPAPTGLGIVERTLLLAALLVHGLTLHSAIFDGGTDTTVVHFGFAIALSFMLWLAIALYWIESFYARIDGLLAIGLPAAAIATLLQGLVPEHHVLVNAGSAAFRLHLLVAMLAYSLFTLAALHALLMSIVKKNLHRGRLSPLLSSLPPLLTMESLLFRVIHIAFVLLTLTLISGFMFSETLFGKALTFNHKTVFAILSWLIFAGLLLGRHLRGWRGRTALLWTQAGFIALLLAYVGSRFVLEVILGRAG